MGCSACGAENPPGFKFCGSCGAPLALTCPDCGSEIPPGFRFCGACGYSLEEGAAEEAKPRDVPSERRRVTVLFADLVGFSTLAEHMDPEELRTLMGETFAEITAQIEAREGSVEKFIGDAAVAIFGAPVAHEDDPERAVAAAIDMLEVVERRSPEAGSSLQLRIGINSGLVVSGAVGDGSQTGVMGDAVNVAARLQQSAGPGEILVSDTVWRRVKDNYPTEEVGAIEVKGREQVVGAYRIAGVRRHASRRQAPFVGRQEELALLDLLWSSAAKGNTHIVSVVGEPGVGKSRLLGEFPRRSAGLDVRIQCGGERAFGPFLDLIEQILGGMPGDVEELKANVAALLGDEETTLLLGTFLGLAGAPPSVRMADEQQKKQVFAGVWQFLLAASKGLPTLVVLEDLHWADKASLDLLEFLLERLGGTPLMLVLAYRPGFTQVERTSLRSSHTAVRLELMSPEDSTKLACGFLGVEHLPAELQRVVVKRAEGNPFFIEELLQALLELGSLAVVEGKAVLAKVDVDVPDTVEGTILARVDRLGPQEHTVIQHAAVVGRSFSSDLLQRVIGDGEISASLDELARAQLLLSQGPDRWSFKHGLIQEVVYDTLLLRQRKEIHRKVAQALETSAADDPALLEVLAEHYALGDAPEKARSYAVAAGDVAAERMGFVEAQQRYETALRVWGEGDEEGRARLLLKLGRAANTAGDSTVAKAALLEAEAAWQSLGNVRQAGSALAILGRAYWRAGESERGQEVLDRAIRLLEPEGSTPELVQAFAWASSAFMLSGDMHEAAELATRGLTLAEELDLPGSRSHLLNTLGVCEATLGDPKGVDRIRAALPLAEESGDAEAIGRVYVNLPDTLDRYALCREGVELCRVGRQVMRKLGSPDFEWFIAANEAHMLVRLGEYEEAEALAQQAMEEERAISTIPGFINAGSILVAIWMRKGRYDEARALMDEIMPLARPVGGVDYLGRNLQQEAEFEHIRGNNALARQSMAEAIEMAEASPSMGHVIDLVASAMRILPDRGAALLERARNSARHPSWEAPLLEAEAVATGDSALFAKAADLYASLHLPYEEIQCRLDAGDLDRARELIDEYGLGKGPLGERLEQLTAVG